LKPIIIESYTESNESLKITRLRNPIVCSGLFLKQTQVYIYIRLIASGIDKIHNCPKCLKEKHFQKFRLPPNLQQMVFPTRMWLNLITTTFILSITTPQRSRTITMRIKNIQLITIDCIDWRGIKTISRGGK
jgi:hypothetical protein